MAFIRKKKVGEHEYYQLVENYRENGHHRQRVLAHLGHFRTVEGALEAARDSLASLERSKLLEQYKHARWAAGNWERSIRRQYGEQIDRYHDGEVPTREEVRRRMGEDRRAPTAGYVEKRSPWGSVYQSSVFAEVPIPPEVDEYCRAFGDGTAVAREERGLSSPDVYGKAVLYPGTYEYKRDIDAIQYWRDRAEKKGDEYNRRVSRLQERIAKLESVVTKTGDPAGRTVGS